MVLTGGMAVVGDEVHCALMLVYSVMFGVTAHLYLTSAGSTICVFALLPTTPVELSVSPIRRTNETTSSISVRLPVGLESNTFRCAMSFESAAPRELDGT